MKSLRKAASILKLFGTDKRQWTLQEITDELGLHKSSVQRIVSTLEEEGFLSSDGGRNRFYRVGLQMFILGNVAIQEMDLARIAEPALKQLVEETQETAHLSIVEGGQCLYINKVACARSISVASKVGAKLPLHCIGVGKVLLSGMKEEEVDRIIMTLGLPQHTPKTITTRGALFKELERIRNQGFSVDNEEFEIGLRCVAAPITSPQGKLIAAISISGPTNRITDDALSMYSRHVIAAADQITQSLSNNRV
jgi:IclR family KDG regulon transcriptional repressor